MAPSTSGSGAVSAITAGSRIRWATSSASLTTPPQLVQVERLEQEVVGAPLHRLDGCICRFGHGDENHRDPRVEAADLLIDLQARLVGESEVQQYHIRRSLGDTTDPLRAGTGHINPVVRVAEDLAHLRQNQVRVVVDEQQLAHGAPRRPTRLELLPEPPLPVWEL